MQKQIVSILIMIFFVTGCVAMTDRQQTIFQGTALGAAGGAAAGAAIGQVIGGDTEATLIGAGIGGVIGGIGGGMWGTHVADKKADYNTTEKYLNACITAAEDATRQAKEYNKKMRTNIKEENKRIEALVAQYNKKQISAGELRKQKNRIDQQIAQMQVDHDAIRFQIDKFKKARSEAANEGSAELLAQLDVQISQLESEANKLGNETTALASKSERIKI